MPNRARTLLWAAFIAGSIGAVSPAHAEPPTTEASAVDDDPAWFAAQAKALFIAGDYPRAEAAYRQAFNLRRRGVGSAALATSHFELGTALEVQVQYKEALAEYGEALRIWTAVGGAQSYDAGMGNGAVATMQRTSSPRVAFRKRSRCSSKRLR